MPLHRNSDPRTCRGGRGETPLLSPETPKNLAPACLRVRWPSYSLVGNLHFIFRSPSPQRQGVGWALPGLPTSCWTSLALPPFPLVSTWTSALAPSSADPGVPTSHPPMLPVVWTTGTVVDEETRLRRNAGDWCKVILQVKAEPALFHPSPTPGSKPRSGALSTPPSILSQRRGAVERAGRGGGGGEQPVFWSTAENLASPAPHLPSLNPACQSREN
jgi:hypothetical protein